MVALQHWDLQRREYRQDMEQRSEQITPDHEPDSPSKRALLKAVWTAPVILSVTLPRVVMAQASEIPAPPGPSVPL